MESFRGISVLLFLSIICLSAARRNNDTVSEATTQGHRSCKDCNDSSAYYLLTQDLLSRESVVGKVPPGGGFDKVLVDFMMTPIDILDVDDVRQVVTSSVMVALYWNDTALTWDKNTGPYKGVLAVNLPIHEIWRPSLLFFNGASDSRMLDTYMGGMATVNSMGTVSIISSPILSFSCEMDLSVYPFDTQKCSLLVYLHGVCGVHANPTESVLFNPRFVENQLAVSAEWTLKKLRVEKKFMLKERSNNIYLEYTWVLQRKKTYFVVSFIAPIVMTSYMNVLVFIIPAESGEKISYLVSIFVSNAVFLGFCSSQMPQGMDATPLVMYLVLGIMGESGLLLIINSIILRSFHRNQQQPTSDRDIVTLTDLDFHSVSATLNTMSKRPLPANAVEPFPDSKEEEGKHEIFKKKEKRVCAKFTLTQLDKIFFSIAVVCNTVFVVSLLMAMME